LSFFKLLSIVKDIRLVQRPIKDVSCLMSHASIKESILSMPSITFI